MKEERDSAFNKMKKRHNFNKERKMVDKRTWVEIESDVLVKILSRVAKEDKVLRYLMRQDQHGHKLPNVSKLKMEEISIRQGDYSEGDEIYVQIAVSYKEKESDSDIFHRINKIENNERADYAKYLELKAKYEPKQSRPQSPQMNPEE